MSAFTALRVHLLLSIVLMRLASANPRQCEPIRIEICSNLGYNYTTMPNLGGNELQHEAEYILKSFNPLIEYGCSAQLKLFLCSIYAPMCTEKVPQPIGPCRRLCENVQRLCYPVLEGFGFAWPDALDCARFPKENNHVHMCMEGPLHEHAAGAAGVGLGNPDIEEVLGQSVEGEHDDIPILECAIKKGLVQYGDRCVKWCHADLLFDAGDKKFAEVWVTVWAIICLVTSLATTLTLCIGGGRITTTSCSVSTNSLPRPPRPLLALALCFCFISISWAIRIIAGRTNTTCQSITPSPSTTVTTIPLELINNNNKFDIQVQDGFTNTNCAFVFLLNYYFTMAANAWWVMLCICWLYASKQRSCADITDRTNLPSQQHRQKRQLLIQHVLAWGVPAIQTLIALIRKDVDVDELTGTCYIGNNKQSSLLLLLILPQAIYLLLGVLVLIVGSYQLIVSSNTNRCRRDTATSASTTTSNTNSKDSDLLGALATLYVIPIASVLVCLSYEYNWQSRHIESTPIEDRPLLWVFLVKHLMSFFIGVSTIFWLWSMRTVVAWRRILLIVMMKRRTPHKHQQQQLPLAMNNVSKLKVLRTSSVCGSGGAGGSGIGLTMSTSLSTNTMRHSHSLHSQRSGRMQQHPFKTQQTTKHRT